MTAQNLQVGSVPLTISDIARWENPRVAVIAISGLLRAAAGWESAKRYRQDACLRKEESIKAAAVALAGKEGRRRACHERIIRTAHGQCESYAEAEMLWLFAAFSIPAPELQYEIQFGYRNEERIFADFAWPGYKVLVEFDGKSKFYEFGNEISRFITRDNVTNEQGWKVFHVTYAMLANPEALARRIAALFPPAARVRVRRKQYLW